MAERRAAFLRTDPAVFRMACEALATLDIRDAVTQVRTPVLVLVGEHDEATPPPMSWELRSLLPNARMTMLPSCAHLPQLQDPVGFRAAIGPFLSRAIEAPAAEAIGPRALPA
jgi:3-oxoadipate enol-lactonase